jgi:CheY-like chemotaxis protein
MKMKVLIVDDDKLLNAVNRKALIHSGFVDEVAIAMNGREGIDHLLHLINTNSSNPDIIILDLDMPVMNGLQFLDEFNKLEFHGKKEIEVIVFTDSDNRRDRQQAMLKGVKTFLDKPYLLRGLYENLRRRYMIFRTSTSPVR